MADFVDAMPRPCGLWSQVRIVQRHTAEGQAGLLGVAVLVEGLVMSATFGVFLLQVTDSLGDGNSGADEVTSEHPGHDQCAMVVSHNECRLGTGRVVDACEAEEECRRREDPMSST
jgi:hypothetical protein